MALLHVGTYWGLLHWCDTPRKCIGLNLSRLRKWRDWEVRTEDKFRAAQWFRPCFPASKTALCGNDLCSYKQQNNVIITNAAAMGGIEGEAAVWGMKCGRGLLEVRAIAHIPADVLLHQGYILPRPDQRHSKSPRWVGACQRIARSNDGRGLQRIRNRSGAGPTKRLCLFHSLRQQKRQASHIFFRQRLRMKILLRRQPR
jgi:hypothetical protein